MTLLILTEAFFCQDSYICLALVTGIGLGMLLEDVDFFTPLIDLAMSTQSLTVDEAGEVRE